MVWNTLKGEGTGKIYEKYGKINPKTTIYSKVKCGENTLWKNYIDGTLKIFYKNKELKEFTNINAFDGFECKDDVLHIYSEYGSDFITEIHDTQIKDTEKTVARCVLEMGDSQKSAYLIDHPSLMC